MLIGAPAEPAPEAHDSSSELGRWTSRDVRAGGRWTRLQRVKNGLIYRLVLLGLWVADRLPRALLIAGGRALGQIAFLVLSDERRRAEHGLERAFGPRRPRALSVFRKAGESLSTCLLLRRSTVRALDLVDVDEASRTLLLQTLAQGRGAVFISPHLGPFELVAAAVAELGHRPAAVVRESYDPRLDAVVDRHRVDRGVEVIHRGAPAAAIRMLRALRDGRPVGFLPDLGARVETRAVHFLGREVALPVGPQRIALRSGAPVLVGALVPEPASGRLTLRIETVGQPGRRPAAANETVSAAEEAELTQRVAAALDTAIRRWPESWLWMSGGPPDAPREAPPLQQIRPGR